MTVSLYQALVPTFLQTLGALEGLLTKAEDHCTENGLAPDDILDARLAEDMFPFATQIKSAVMHSAGAIEAVSAGVFTPDRSPAPGSFEACRARVAEGRASLLGVDPGALEACIGRDMRFERDAFRMDFTADEFLLSFSQPNFFFHATTAYAILRMKKVRIGKRDYLGQIRLKS